MLGNANNLRIFGIDNAQHRHLGDAAHFVKGAARRTVDQAFIRHVLEQRLKRNFLIALQAKGTGNFPLARRSIRLGNEVKDLLARRQASKGGLGHRDALPCDSRGCQQKHQRRALIGSAHNKGRKAKTEIHG
jgi:hypothetical protein